MSQKQRHPLRRIFLFGLIAVVTVHYSVKLVRSVISFHDLQSQKESFSGNSNDLKNTIVVPALDYPLQPGKNMIWCSSFQLAWNEIKDNVIKEPVQITDALELCAKLNSALQNKTDLLPESYYVAAGKVSDGIAKKISSDMANRFPSKRVPPLDSSMKGFIAYSYLETYLEFTTPFLENKNPLTFTDSSGRQMPVKSFGIWGDFSHKKELLGKQVDVLYCKVENYIPTEFALDLCKDTKPYQVVVAIVTPSETLQATYDHLQSEINLFKEQSSNINYELSKKIDTLYVPDMFWQITHHFGELEGKSLANPSVKGLPIEAAVQMIQFRLDRSGVTLKSESFFKYFGVSIFPQFIFDKPFLLYLKKRDVEQPFFMMWVDNAELLTPFRTQE